VLPQLPIMCVILAPRAALGGTFLAPSTSAKADVEVTWG